MSFRTHALLTFNEFVHIPPLCPVIVAFARAQPRTKDWVRNSTLGYYICAWPFWGLSDHFYHGFVDEFRVWNYARSQQQILETMSRTLTGHEPG